MRLQHAVLGILLIPNVLRGLQARPWQSTNYCRLTVVSSPSSRTGPPWLLVDRLDRIRTWFAHWIGTGDAAPAAATSQR